MLCCVVSVLRVFAACCGTGRMLHLVCGVCRVARWLSSTMLRACCWLCAARCSPRTKCGGAVCFMLHPACACVLLHVIRCLMHVVCCMRCLVLPSSARCLLHAACCVLPRCLVACCQWSFPKFLLHAARCPLHAACCMLRCTTVLSAACCLKSGASCLFCCALHFSRRMFPVACCLVCIFQWSLARCLLRAVRGTLSVGPCLLHVVCCLLHVACGLLSIACRTFSVACGLWSAARPRVPMSHGVRCPSPVPRRISSRCMCCVASRLLHDARPLFACCLLSVACPILHAVRCLLHR